jgi:hypothetical protein
MAQPHSIIFLSFLFSFLLNQFKVLKVQKSNRKITSWRRLGAMASDIFAGEVKMIIKAAKEIEK